MIINIPEPHHTQYRLNIINYYNITVNANILAMDADKKARFFQMCETYVDIFDNVPHQGIPLVDYIVHGDEHHTVKGWDTSEPEDYYLCPLVKQYKIWKDTGTVCVADDHAPINARDIQEYNYKNQMELEYYNRDVMHYLRFHFCNDLLELSTTVGNRVFELILIYSDILEAMYSKGIPAVDYQLYCDEFKTIKELHPHNRVFVPNPFVKQYIEWKNTQ